ncbi:MAG: N-acetylglucosamine-6-phosphate deacetylase [Nocardioidaceae bacterium]|nr:N-acetylglucosamine-6-phosphate deacetylase [Nocardioidaceae bacterium]
MSLLIHNGRQVDAGGVTDDAWVYATSGRIEATGTGTSWRDDIGARASDRAVRVDAQGMTLTPGFIDLHAHGGAGRRFEDGPPAIEAALAIHRRHGTTRSVVSLASSDLDSLARSLTDVAELAGRDPLVLGSHLEGPYLSPNRCGAHDPAVLRAPRLDEVTALVDAAGGTLRQITIAPELPGALDAIRQLTTQGVVAAVGHTEADYARTLAAFDAGASVLTHAYNGMPGIGHRAPGPVVAAFDDDRVFVEIINDGHHVDARVVALTFANAQGRVALITDAMAAAGAGDGDFSLGGRAVTVTQGVARLTGTGTLAGSTITLDVALRGAVQAGIPEPVAVAAATSVPAAALGLGDRLGRLSVGYAADLVLLDAAWRVVTVFADGVQLFD